MTLLDFFAGIGTIRIGFEQAGWSCNGHVEWDKFAQASYNAMHDIKEGEFCGWDIREVRADELPRSDLWTFGAPCQDFSIAGKRKGMGGERSSLVNEIFRLIEETPEENRPTWLLYENVKGMLSSNGGWDFLGILLEMDRLGYDVEWQLLNSKHFGVPQNRERVFTLGHLRGRGGQKVFPIARTDEPIDTEHKRLNPNMALCKLEKPYIDGKFASMIGDDVTIRDIGCEIAGTVTARYYKGLGANSDNAVLVRERVSQKVVGINQIANIDQHKRKRKNPQTGRVYGTDGISPCLSTMQGGRQEPKIAIPCQAQNAVMVREATKQGYAIAEPGDSINLEQPNSKTRRGRVGKGVANTLTTGCQMGTVQDLRIRKLTPRECWRLQGIPDHYFDKASAVNSDSQLYKQAGNACTVNVMYEIAKRI